MKQYPAAFRARLLRAVDAGLARSEAARLFGVHDATIARWQQRRADVGSVAPSPRPGRPPRVAPAQHATLRAQVTAHPDATLAEHCARWASAHDVRVSPATMSRLLTRLGLPLKKNARGPRAGSRRAGPVSGGARYP